MTVFLSVVAALPGDYNFDGVVDAADYTVWREALGQTGIGLAADGDESGEVDQGDYGVWLANYGAVLPPAETAAVPEPTTLGLGLIGGAMALGRKRPRQRNKERAGFARNPARIVRRVLAPGQ